jgi:thioredoxin reductase
MPSCKSRGNLYILVVVVGDSAVEAAMGLAEQRGNKVTLSYGQDRFSRIKREGSKGSSAA